MSASWTIGRKKDENEKIPDTVPLVLKSFDVRLVSPHSLSGSFRVFIQRSELFFIQIEDTTLSSLAALAPFLGPFGNIIPLTLWLFNRGKNKARKQKIEHSNPEDLLHEDGKSFKLYAAEIRDASIEPMTFFTLHGKAGRLILIVRHGEKIKFGFVTETDTRKAIELLPSVLSATLRVNVEWAAGEARFVKRKKA
jgi:hypothetical protein